MKRLFCLLLTLLMLCACAAGPALQEGYYLMSLEDSCGSPMYFCLESGGTGYVHAMGRDVPITWTRDGIGGEFADGVVTENGIEFPTEEGTLVCTYSADLPESYTQPVLRPGFYIPEDEEFESLMCYAELREDGTGEFSIMGMSQPIEWEPTKFCFGDMIATATETGFSIRETVTTEFTWVGDALPDGYLPDPPAPGIYCISSIGYNGDMTFYSAYTKDNGYLELTEDGTGTLVFAGESYPFTLDGLTANFDGWSMTLMSIEYDSPGDPPLAVGYTTTDCPIEADSIAFRLLEGE